MTDVTRIRSNPTASDEKPAEAQTRWQVVPLPIGYVLDNTYVIKELIGRGGFALVYVAHDRNFDMDVAIKEYGPNELAIRNDDFSVSERQGAVAGGFDWGKARFIGEAKALARLRHEHIVRVLRVFEFNNTVYMVLEKISGKTVPDLLKAGDLSVNQDFLDRFLLALLDALDTVHAMKTIHRDVKPQNIMIVENRPVLMDFGGSTTLSTTPRKENFAALTPGYAPAEQYLATGVDLGPWTDIYGMAATLYEMVTGQKPIPSIERIIEDKNIPIARLAKPGYRPEFLSAIDWGLAPLPKDRPQSIAEWRARLFANTISTTIAPARKRGGSKIFISYRRSDTRHMTGRLYDRLFQEFGDDQIFFDVDSIPAGVDFRNHIRTSIEESAVVLAIVGPGWVNKAWTQGRGLFSFRRSQEDFVAIELDLALQINVPVLPILVDGTPMPEAGALPASLKKLCYLNGSPVRAGRDFRTDMDRIVAAIQLLRAEALSMRRDGDAPPRLNRD